jgi:cytochrome c553
VTSGKLLVKIIKQAAAIAVILICIPAIGWAQSTAAAQEISDFERTALFPSRGTIEIGREAADTNCVSCHGVDGLSDAEGKPHLAGQRTIYLYRVLKAFQSGERRDEDKNHNNFLNEKALLSTAVYYSSLTPPHPVAIAEPVQSTETGLADEEDVAEPVDDPFSPIRVSMKKCIKCHDESGAGSGSGMPSLNAQDPEYFVTAMMAYVNGSRNHKLMGRLVGKLDEKTIKEMGVFYAVQDPLKSETQGEGDANVGRRLSEGCEGCHGYDGNAKNPSMPTLAGQDAKYFIKAMKHYKDGTRQHKNMFGAVGALTQQEMIDLATYYAIEEPRRRDVRMPLNSTEWIARCERCHGIDGNSSDSRFPMLAGQDETYLGTALKAYASGALESSTMHAMGDPLSSMDIEHISKFFASQQPKAVVYMQLPCGDDK